MKTLLPFLKPYRGKCVFILLVTLADVAGALLIPTITADMINIAVEGYARGSLCLALLCCPVC